MLAPTVTLEPDPVSGWRLAIAGELMLSHVAGVYADLDAALAALGDRASTFEHAAELARDDYRRRSS